MPLSWLEFVVGCFNIEAPAAVPVSMACEVSINLTEDVEEDPGTFVLSGSVSSSRAEFKRDIDEVVENTFGFGHNRNGCLDLEFQGNSPNTADDPPFSGLSVCIATEDVTASGSMGGDGRIEFWLQSAGASVRLGIVAFAGEFFFTPFIVTTDFIDVHRTTWGELTGSYSVSVSIGGFTGTAVFNFTVT